MYLGRKALPSVNPLVTRRQYERSKDIHHRKLRNIKCSVDCHAPNSFKKGKRRNLKKEQLMEERYTEIERDNRHLLEKMSVIMQSNSLDNINKGLKYSKSLNRGFRKRQLAKITVQNQDILRRIQSSEPTYDHWQWEEQRREMEQTMQNICEYKPQTAHPSSPGRLRGGQASGPLDRSWSGQSRGSSRGAPRGGGRSGGPGFGSRSTNGLRPSTAPVEHMRNVSATNGSQGAQGAQGAFLARQGLQYQDGGGTIGTIGGIGGGPSGAGGASRPGVPGSPSKPQLEPLGRRPMSPQVV